MLRYLESDCQMRVRSRTMGADAPARFLMMLMYARRSW
jgi:hypothetical protein